MHKAMCALSQESLQRVEDALYANVDFFKLFQLVSINTIILPYAVILLADISLPFNNFLCNTSPVFHVYLPLQMQGYGCVIINLPSAGH